MTPGTESPLGELTRWPVLKPVGPDLDPRNVCVNRYSCVVGARSRVHLPLKSPLVSRSHALIIRDTREVYVRDLASRNGLQVNGTAVREKAIRGGDLLRFGPVVFQCLGGFPSGSGEADGNGSPHARLESSGSAEGHAIEGRTFLLGRREGCDLVLSDPLVSRVHLVIFRRGGRCFVRDLNSKNGTALNGTPVREAELAEGDELRIVGHRFLYRVLEVPGHPDAAAALEPAQVEEAWHRPADQIAPADLSVTSGSLSASGSVGAKTADARAPGAAPEGPEATSEDIGFGPTAPAGEPVSADPEQADVNEVFSAESAGPSQRKVEDAAGSGSDNGRPAYHPA